LDTLYDVIKSKSKRNNTSSEKLMEQIMYKYLELCVELKKSHHAKEGLFQYRNMCQGTNVASLASVVQYYLDLAEKRTESAKQESQSSVQDVDDLDNLATPEMIMLSAVSGEDAQDRSDRAILMPWVKFLWESYCQCLELLRTNNRVERLYHDIAQQAFKFSLKYQRKTEFRKLCDKLRNHLDLVLKQTPSTVTINLNSAETQQMNLDTRLVQLDAAIHMELWQEAYKAVEDIHGLMTLSKKVFPPKMMANYYQKLALVFWKSGNLLFHAAAVLKHFQLTREMKKNLSAEETGKMASRVLAACLAVPIPSQRADFDKFIETDRTPQEKQARLAVLLSLQQAPTRQTLLRDAVRFGVIEAALPQVQDLYRFLEVDFHPLHLCRRVEKGLRFVEEAEELSSLLGGYVAPLKDVTLVRLLKQVAQVYQSVKFERLLELAPFADAFWLEAVIVNCVRSNDMQIRVDHRTRVVHFGTDLAEAQSREVAEGPHLQDMPSEQIRTQLMKMLVVLDKSLKTIHPDKTKIENSGLRQKIVEAYHQSKQRDHQRILGRHKAIEERKEYLEKLSVHREAEEQRKADQIKRERQEAEERRLRAEKEARDRLVAQQKMDQIKQDHITEKISQIKQTEVGKKMLSKMDEKEIAELDTEKIMAKQVEELEKEKQELVKRLKAQEKKVDHLERAKRKEEISLLKAESEKDQELDKVWWSQKEAERIAQAIKDREVAVESKKRMMRMKEDKDSYLSDLLSQRKSAFDKKIREYNAKLEKERAARLAERKEARKDERREKWQREKAEEEQRRREEQMKREREEKARLDAERRAREEEEYRKRQEQLDAIAEKQRQREREMEEKLSRDRAAPPQRGGGGGRDERDETGAGWRRGPEREEGGGGGGSSWRDRRSGDNERRGDDRRDERRGPASRDDDRRGPPGGRDDEKRGPAGGGSGGGAWRPGGGSWRDRERRKDDEWGPRKRDDDDRGPVRRGQDDERGPPMRRGGPDEDRGTMRRDQRDEERGGPSMRRGLPGEDDRGPIRRRDDERAPPMRRRDDDERGPLRRDERGPPRRDDASDWRRGPREEVGGGRDEHQRGGGGMRRSGPDREEGGGWRRGGDDRREERRDDRREQRREGGRDGDGGDNWRSGAPRRGGGGGGAAPDDRRRDDRRGPARAGPGSAPDRASDRPPKSSAASNQDEDGWTTVKR